MKKASNIWEDDGLHFEETANNFTRLIDLEERAKVISIEAGFGFGKTFFRERWASQLREEGETVVEFDAWKTDHSNDPVISLLSEMLSQAPEINKKSSASQQAYKYARSVGAATLKIGVAAVARGAAEEVSKLLSGDDGELDGAMSMLEDAGNQATEALSKAAQQLITQHIAAEKVRNNELPNKLDALRSAITGKDDGRIIVFVDELDRCRPDYALQVLESFKHIFDRPGYLFFLFANPVHIEAVASSMYGASPAGQHYLDKFVDLRLKLPDNSEIKANAAIGRLRLISPWNPLNDDHPEAFLIDETAKVLNELIRRQTMSMRQILQCITWFEISIKCNPKAKIDGPLLMLLTFRTYLHKLPVDEAILDYASILPRSRLTETLAIQLTDELNDAQNLRGGIDIIERKFSDFHILAPSFDPYFVEFAGSYLKRHQSLVDMTASITAN